MVFGEEKCCHVKSLGHEIGTWKRLVLSRQHEKNGWLRRSTADRPCVKGSEAKLSLVQPPTAPLPAFIINKEYRMCFGSFFTFQHYIRARKKHALVAPGHEEEEHTIEGLCVTRVVS
jgi:hypothetical protein